MSRKYFELAVVKTNKPNSKKTMQSFAEEFGYTDFTMDNLDFDKRAIGIKMVSDDLLFEIENFSKKSDDKFTLSYVKIERKNLAAIHVLRKNEFVNGEMTLEEKDDTKRILIEKEEKALRDKRVNKHQHRNKQTNKPHHPKNKQHQHRNKQSNNQNQQKPKNTNTNNNENTESNNSNKNAQNKTNSRNHLRRSRKPKS